MSWKLGLPGQEQKIYKPTGFMINPIPIERRERTASGKLVKDIIAIKHEFILSYNALPPEPIKILKTEYNRHMVLNFIYPDIDGDEMVKIWFESFPREKLLTPLHLWGNFSIRFEEQ
jgi:hypothetical protein